MSERRRELLETVDHLRAAHDRWAKAKNIPYLTAPLERAIDGTVLMFEDGDLPADCRGLARSVERLAEVWGEVKRRYALAADKTDPAPLTQEFWRALDGVIDARDEAEPKRAPVIESIETLEKQGVRDAQICKIYDWVEDDGSPQVWKLAEERENPGKHTKNHVPAVVREREERERKRREFLDTMRRQRDQKIASMREPDQTPLRELVEEGLAAVQIARMKKTTVEDVLEQCDAAGIPRPPERYEYPDRGEHEPGIPEETQRALEAERENPTRGRRRPSPATVVPEMEDGEDDVVHMGTTVEEEIRQLHGEGLTAPEIRARVSTEQNEVPMSLVVQTIRAARAQA